ncbi:FF domain [Cordyceps militaris]|uniref:FF domain n=1 Tax=Cordyceps militaris TaxID=73501 RepID=A0A2H4S7K7_CORMI|nr:FF domain [Cordyceps militaris]
MNGYGGPQAPPASTWAEHHTPDGRAYYYNSATQVTQWTKPEDMMTPAERALSSQPWKEYTAEGGRKYWYNTETKQSSWEMPEAFKAALGHTGVPAAAPFSQGNASTGYDSHRDGRDARDYRDNRDHRDQRDHRDHRDQRDRRDRGDHRDHRDYRDRDSYADGRQLAAPIDPKIRAFVPANDDPDYATLEEAEAAFAKLLRRSGVQPDWTWEQAIRASAKDPQFRAIKDPKDRRAAFEKYCLDVVSQDKERAAERMTKLRNDFVTMLKRHPEIRHYTRWKTGRAIIEGETTFRSTSNEIERRNLFEEYVQGLKKAHKEQQSNIRKSAMDGLLELLPQLSLEPYSSWSDAQKTLSSTTTFQTEEKYKSLTQYDILTAFQNHMKALERAFNDAKQEEKNMKYRKERKARDAFKPLLAELRKDGKINAKSTWSQILPVIENDERYIGMAGLNDGSTAQELFWDAVEEEERNLRGPRNHVLDVLEDKRVEITPTSELEEFMSIMRDDRRTANIDPDTLKLLFERLRDKRTSKRDEKRDEDRQPDRHQRRTMDDARAHLKRMDPPVTLSDTFDKVRPRLLKVAEFQSLPDDALHSVFDRHMRRLREKDEDVERGVRRSSERDVAIPRRDGDRTARGDRDRERSRRGAGGAPRRRSRSPELDPYEADRRKAIAERERNHRKSTMAENLLGSERGAGGRPSSPPVPSARRDREPREHREPRDYDRPSRSRRDDDRDTRRDREEDRDRYRRRGAERGSYDELPYGDERPAGTRRRRQDEENDYARRDSRDSKRARRDRSRERTPPRDERRKSPARAAAAAAVAPDVPSKDKDAEMLSGSEEGEIEE